MPSFFVFACFCATIVFMQGHNSIKSMKIFSEKPSRNFLISMVLVIAAVTSARFLDNVYVKFDNFPDISKVVFMVLATCALVFYLVGWQKYALGKKHRGSLGIIVGMFVLVTSLFVLGKTFFIIQKRMQEAHIESNYPVVVNKNELIEKSGYAKEDVDEIIKELKVQKGIEEKKVLFIERVSEAEARIKTGEILGPLKGSGADYGAKKVDGRWIISDGSFWIS